MCRGFALAANSVHVLHMHFAFRNAGSTTALENYNPLDPIHFFHHAT